MKLKAFHAALLAGCATAPRPLLVVSDARQGVMDAERAFARTMAERDLAAFGRRDPPGAGRVVFDKVARACECTATAQ